MSYFVRRLSVWTSLVMMKPITIDFHEYICYNDLTVLITNVDKNTFIKKLNRAGKLGNRDEALGLLTSVRIPGLSASQIEDLANLQGSTDQIRDEVQLLVQSAIAVIENLSDEVANRVLSLL